MGKIIIGCWDCTYCGTCKISGELRECPNCGHPRDKDIKFYMDDPEHFAADPDKVSREADWLCENCDSLNPASVTICPSCGTPRGAASPDYFDNKEKREQEEREAQQKLEERLNPQAAAQKSSSSGTGRPSSPLKRFLPIVIIAAVIALVLFLVLPKDKNLEIVSCGWERSVEVEVYKEVEENSWELPADAYDVTTRQEIYAYDHVLDHYETRTRQVSERVLDGYDISYSYRDLGNGHFEQVENRTPRYRTEYHTETYQEPIYRDDPIYKTRYYYLVMRWVSDHWETTSGENDEPYFADVAVSAMVRTGSQTEDYRVTDTKGKTYRAAYDIWKKLHAGDHVKAKVQFGEIIEIE